MKSLWQWRKWRQRCIKRWPNLSGWFTCVVIIISLLLQAGSLDWYLRKWGFPIIQLLVTSLANLTCVIKCPVSPCSLPVKLVGEGTKLINHSSCMVFNGFIYTAVISLLLTWGCHFPLYPGWWSGCTGELSGCGRLWVKHQTGIKFLTKWPEDNSASGEITFHLNTRLHYTITSHYLRVNYIKETHLCVFNNINHSPRHDHTVVPTPL